MNGPWDPMIDCPHCGKKISWRIDDLPVSDDTQREVIQCENCLDLMILDVYSPPPIIRIYMCVADPIVVEGPVEPEPPADHGGLND